MGMITIKYIVKISRDLVKERALLMAMMNLFTFFSQYCQHFGLDHKRQAMRKLLDCELESMWTESVVV
jgi:hypothetical protein